MFRAPTFDGVDIAELFNASPNPYLILDRGLTIMGMNEAYLRATMRVRSDIMGRNIFDAFPSDPDSTSGQMLRASFDRVLAEKKPDHLALIPYDIALPDGRLDERFWSATHTPLLGADGEVDFILQHTVDVTELHRLRQDVASRSIIIENGMFQRAEAVQAENQLLSEESGRLRRMFHQAPGFMAVLRGPNHVFELANAAYLRLVSQRDVVGKTVAQALPEVVAQGFIKLLDEVRESGKPFIGRGVDVMLQPEPNGPLEQRYVDFIYQPILAADAEVVGIFVQGHDITDQKRAEQDLERQTNLLRLAQEAGGVGTFEWDLATDIVRASGAFAELYGLPEATEGVHASVFSGIVHPDDLSLLATTAGESIEKKVQRTEYRVITPHGTRWLARQGEVIRDAAGKPLRVVGAAYDVTDRKEAEAQLRLLMQESAHRVKNMLAMVSAVTSQTLRNAASTEEARVAVSARLAALSQAQDALMHGSGTCASIGQVVESATRLHSETFGRFDISGPDVTIAPKAVLGLTLMLHELGTNALKYGALSAPEGRVNISWRLDEGAANLILEWRESGGPPVSEPTRKGFGSKLIERSLGDPVKVVYAPEGLFCQAVIRLPERSQAA